MKVKTGIGVADLGLTRLLLSDALSSSGITQDTATGKFTLTVPGGAITTDLPDYPAIAMWELLDPNREAVTLATATDMIRGAMGKFVVDTAAGAASDCYYGMGIIGTTVLGNANGWFYAQHRTGGGDAKISSGEWLNGVTSITDSGATAGWDTVTGTWTNAFPRVPSSSVAVAFLSSDMSTPVVNTSRFVNNIVGTGPLCFVLFGGRSVATAGEETPIVELYQGPVHTVDLAGGSW